MDFDLPAEDDPRRLAVRAWVEANPRPTARDLLDAGYAAPHWPPPYGLSAGPEMQIIIDDELGRAGIKRPLNLVMENNCGPSLLSHGTEAAKARYIIPGLLGEERWCQLYSEPAGGSDLASLRTTAVRDGDDYIVNGRKIWISNGRELWTSEGHKNRPNGARHADIGCLIARTDPHAAKHAGLTQFLVELDSPGITIQPIADMSGLPAELNEIVLEDVRVPAANRLGQEGEGWRLAMQQVQSERVKLSLPGALNGGGPTARDLVAALDATGALQRPGVREEAARLYIEGEYLRLLAARALSDRVAGRPAGPEASVSKMLASPHCQRIFALSLTANGHRGLLEDEDQFAPGVEQFEERASWTVGPWFAPTITLAAGAQDIMRNVVGERVLGLPRDLDPSAKGDWSEHEQKRAAALRGG